MDTIDGDSGSVAIAAARQLVDRVKARPAEGLEEADRWLERSDPLAVVAAHWAKGAAFYELGRNDDALQEFATAINEGPDLLNDWVGISMAAAENAAGKQQIATERLTNLMSAEREDVTLLAKSQLGMIRLHQGEIRESLSLLEEAARGLSDYPKERVGLARILGNAGYCGLMLGDVRTAEQHFTDAMVLARETDQHMMVAGLNHNLAYVRMCLGDLPSAIASFRRAIEAYHALGKSRNLVSLYDDLAEAYRFAGLNRDAVRYARLSVWTARQGSNVEDRADSLFRYAQCLYAHGSFSAATSAAEQAATIFAETDRSLWATRAELVAVAASARAGTSSGDTEEHAIRLNAIAHRLRALGATAAASTAVNIAAQLHVESGCVDLAREVLSPWVEGPEGRSHGSDHILDEFERLFSRTLLAHLTDGRASSNLIDAHSRLEELLTGVADAELRNGVVRLATRFRTVALDEALDEAIGSEGVLNVVRTEDRWRFGSAVGGLGVSAAAEDGSLTEHLGMLRLLKRERRQTTEVDSDLEHRINELEAEIRELSIGSSVGGVPRPEAGSAQGSAAAVFDWIAADDGVFVQLFEHRSEVHTVVVSSERARHQVVGSAAQLENDLVAFRSSIGRLLRSRSTARTADVLWQAVRADGQALGEKLIGPVGPGRSVLISSPPGFAPLPWSLLFDEASPISVISSSSVWQSSAPTVSASDVAIVVGPELDHAEVDAAAIARLVASSHLLAAEDASCDGLLTALSSNTMVHVAAHSHFRPDSVMFSSLQMYDGPVPVYELARLKRSPQLVVLAACEAGGTGGTGFGEWLGLVPELLRSGSECLVAPIRPVADADAAAVMAAFYRNLRGNSVAGALAAARAELAYEPPRLQAAAHAFLAFGRGNAVVEP